MNETKAEPVIPDEVWGILSKYGLESPLPDSEHIIAFESKDEAIEYGCLKGESPVLIGGKKLLDELALLRAVAEAAMCVCRLDRKVVVLNMDFAPTRKLAEVLSAAGYPKGDAT